MPKPAPVKNLRNYAIWLLGRRDYSRKELKTKLSQRTAEPEKVEPLLDRLTEQGLLSDTRFTESKVRYMALTAGKGPQHIRQVLKTKGIPVEDIEAQLACEEYDWFALAQEARQRKFGEAMPADYKSKAKQQNFLMARGFTYDQIRHAFETTHAP